MENNKKIEILENRIKELNKENLELRKLLDDEKDNARHYLKLYKRLKGN